MISRTLFSVACLPRFLSVAEETGALKSVSPWTRDKIEAFDLRSFGTIERQRTYQPGRRRT